MSAEEATTAPAAAEEGSTGILADRDWLRVYIWALGLFSVTAISALVWLQLSWSVLPTFSVAGVIFFAGLSTLTERYSISPGRGLHLSAGFLADFLGAAITGPLGGALVACAPFLVQYRRGKEEQTIAQVGSFILVGAATGMVYWVVAGEVGPGIPGIVAGGFLAAVTYQGVNWLLVSPVMWLRRGLHPLSLFDEAFKPALPYHAFFLLLSLVLMYSFVTSGPWVFGLFLLPVAGLIYAFRAFAEQRDLTGRLETFSLQMAASMITALDLKDNYTAQHSATVALYSHEIATEMGLDESSLGLTQLAGLLHDLGKISVPDHILNNSEPLKDQEWERVRAHATAGHKILSNMSEFERLGEVILHHHERYDGRGYPHGLVGEEIPMVSRIVGTADAYSAMISDRPYSPARTPEEAMSELLSQCGGQFDPRVVASFIGLLENGSEDYRHARDIDFHVQFQKVRLRQNII